MSTRLQIQMSELYRQTSSNIYNFCRALGFEPTPQQRQLLDAVQAAKFHGGCRRIAVKSGQGPGKTTASAVVGLFCTWINLDAMTIVTAPTMRQCRDVWLKEVGRLLERADPLLRAIIKTTKTKVVFGNRAAWGIDLVTSTKDTNVQGSHHPNMTVIAEEASGVSDAIITQYKGTLSNPDSLFLQIGNPNTRDCSFFKCFSTERGDWASFTWNAEETPESKWFSKRRNRELEEEFGRDSDVYRIRVLGEFPLQDPNCVISSDDLEKVMDQTRLLQMSQRLRPYTSGGGLARQIGIDLARYGGDESTIYRRLGYSIVEWKRFPHSEPTDVVAAAFRMQSDALWTDKDTLYVPDATGIGQGVLGTFHRAGKRVVEFHNHGKPRSQDYENRVTEAWFSMARIVKARGCCLPNDPTLIQQLATRQYYTSSKGKLVLESKDDYVKRGHDSPDRADGCVMAMSDDVVATSRVASMDEEKRTSIWKGS